jgi:hypothetical protein
MKQKAPGALLISVLLITVMLIVAPECEKVVENFVNEAGVTGSAGALLAVVLSGALITYLISRKLKNRGS